MQMLSARYGVSRAGLTILVSRATALSAGALVFPAGMLATCMACTWAAPGPWHFSQPMANSENGLLSNLPFVPATEFGRPLWQKMQPAVIGRSKPRSTNSYPGEGAQLL